MACRWNTRNTVDWPVCHEESVLRESAQGQGRGGKGTGNDAREEKTPDLEIVEGSWNEHLIHKRNTHPCTPCPTWMRDKGVGEYSTGNGHLKSSAKLHALWIPGGWAVEGALSGSTATFRRRTRSSEEGQGCGAQGGAHRFRQCSVLKITEWNFVGLVVTHVLFQCERSPFKPMCISSYILVK